MPNSPTRSPTTGIALPAPPPCSVSLSIGLITTASRPFTCASTACCLPPRARAECDAIRASRHGTGRPRVTSNARATCEERSPMSDEKTAAVVQRFITAFLERDPAAFVDLVADDCVMETMQPAPAGARYEGYDANVAFWQTMVLDRRGTFEVEDVWVAEDRAVNRWKYTFGVGKDEYVRGVTILRVRGGKIAEALAYAKVPDTRG